LRDFVFTSESVSEGHPDKVCDQISDAILDAYLREDPFSRTAVEVAVTDNRVVVMGEVRGPASITEEVVRHIVRETVKNIGYDQPDFHWQNLIINYYLHSQSADIAMGVDAKGDKDEGAGDQGLMFGYATRDTDALMPAPVYYSHRILELLAKERKAGPLKDLGPDAKTQLSLRYVNGKPDFVETVVLSTQHSERLSQGDVRDLVMPVIKSVLPAQWVDDRTRFLINPTGRFVVGGPVGDTGLTGRKIIVDTYGGSASHGGGAFSGKDPTKVDRSGAYIARYLAKNIVAAGLADRCTIQLSYAIGVSEPTSLFLDLHGTGHIDVARLEKILPQLISLTPRGIREHLKLNRPIYLPTASYGHFGRDFDDEGHFTWEKLDLVGELKAQF